MEFCGILGAGDLNLLRANYDVTLRGPSGVATYTALDDDVSGRGLRCERAHGGRVGHVTRGRTRWLAKTKESLKTCGAWQLKQRLRSLGRAGKVVERAENVVSSQ